MADNTPNLNLYLPGGGSTGLITPDEVADIDRLNENFRLIDAFAGSLGNQSQRTRDFKGPAADRGTIVPTPVVGDTYQETDGDRQLYRYDGSNWISTNGGSFLIVPSSVGGTNVTKAGGRVTAAASPEILIDGVFSTRFRRYLIVIDLDSASVAVATNLQLRAGGATQVGNYITQTTYNSTDSSIVTAKSGPNNDAQIGPGLGTSHRQITLEVSFAALAAPTLLAGKTATLLGAHHLLGDIVVRHSPSTIVDGIRISPSAAATLTGTVSVYGRP